ncbi:MAG: TatD family hydrolase [Candidatus Krumholzibacteria bacterium]|jgi:TatD DNase family protein|nr:TatD family hydrolase [Candidatus Krumholzibacteria bacterium]MDP7022352.1 TatD family hydrolase [Candidatus Krumholzibacteria bacterium]
MLDSHAHLHREEFDADREEVVARLKAAGVRQVLEVGIDEAGGRKALALAREHDFLKVALGFHPHEASRWSPAILEELRNMIEDENCVALGEMGLDYFRDYSPRDLQDACFRDQLKLAHELDMPVIFHVRAAESDFLRIVDEIGPPRRAVLHAFSHEADFARDCLDRGFYLGIGGILTYPKSRLPEILRELSPERILPETDCPWLSPQPLRGKRNEPSHLIHVREKLAEIYGVSEERMDEINEASYAAFLGMA